MTAAKAGSTSGASSIQNLNTANIQGALQGYANSLRELHQDQSA